MPDPDHEYDKLFSLQGTSHERALSQTIDCMRNAQPFGLWNTRQFLRGASLNPNGVAHL